MQNDITRAPLDPEPALVKAINVTGRVQGVWFRKNTLQQAQKRQLEGWVMNMEDGSVQVHLQGAESQVRDMIGWLRKGSPLSRVDHLDISDADPLVMDGFEIR